MSTKITGRALHGGKAAGPIIVLQAPVSFWGGFDPATGRIIDQAHPDEGQSLSGAIVAMPGSRGSSGTPGVLGEALRRGTGPAALVVTKADINLLAGVIVAEALYDRACPLLLVNEADFATITTANFATLTPDGTLTL